MSFRIPEHRSTQLIMISWSPKKKLLRSEYHRYMYVGISYSSVNTYMNVSVRQGFPGPKFLTCAQGSIFRGQEAFIAPLDQLQPDPVIKHYGPAEITAATMQMHMAMGERFPEIESLRLCLAPVAGPAQWVLCVVMIQFKINAHARSGAMVERSIVAIMSKKNLLWEVCMQLMVF